MSSPTVSTPTTPTSASAAAPSLSEIHFREATFDDIEQLVAIVNWAYRGKPTSQSSSPTSSSTTTQMSWATDAHYISGARTSIEGMKRMITSTTNRDGNHQVRIFVAERSTSATPQCLGCVKVEHDRDTDYAEFGMLAVDPHQQSGGIGTQLMAYAHNYALNELKCKYGRMYVINHAKELYNWYTRRLGYTETGVRAPFPSDSKERLLRDDVCFIELQRPLVPVTSRFAEITTTSA